MLHRHPGRFNVPTFTPAPMAIGRTWIRVGDEWFKERQIPMELYELLESHKMSHDDTIGVTWFHWSLELAKALGVQS